MANVVIANNGNDFLPANQDTGQEEVPASPSILVTNENGNVVIIAPNVSVGFPLGVYKIEVV